MLKLDDYGDPLRIACIRALMCGLPMPVHRTSGVRIASTLDGQLAHRIRLGSRRASLADMDGEFNTGHYKFGPSRK